MSEKPFKCIYCEAEYDEKESLDRHVEYAHTLYKKGNMERTELKTSQKVKKFLTRHPIIFGFLLFVIWFTIGSMFPNTWPFNDGFTQMVSISILGLGFGITFVYEVLNFGG